MEERARMVNLTITFSTEELQVVKNADGRRERERSSKSAILILTNDSNPCTSIKTHCTSYYIPIVQGHTTYVHVLGVSRYCTCMQATAGKIINHDPCY